MKIKYCAIFIVLLVPSQVFAESRVESLKKFYDDENYPEAQEIIKEILGEENLEANGNKYEGENEKEQEEGSEKHIEEKLFTFFFDGLIHLKQNDFIKAEESFGKIIELKNDWEQISEVYYRLGQINFLQKKYSNGLDFLNLITDKKISSSEIDNLIQHFFAGEVDDLELNRCVCKNPENNFIARKWFHRQSQLSFSDRYIWLLQYFFSKKEYQNYKKKFFNKVKLKKKKKYNLAVLLPLDLKRSPKNSRFYDFYNLFSLAVEDFSAKEKFQFFFYDTQKNGESLEEILDLEELKNMDVLINVSKKNLVRVSEFSRDNEILLYDFAAKKLSCIGDNDFAFLTRVSEETYSLGAAKFILNEIKGKEKSSGEQSANVPNVTVVYVKEDYKNAEIFKNYLSLNRVQSNDIALTKEELKNLLYNVRVNLNTIKKEKLKKEAKEEKPQEELWKQQEENFENSDGEDSKKEETEKLEIIKILEGSDYVFLASNDVLLLGNMICIAEQYKLNPKIFCDYELLNSELAEEIFNKENIFCFTANEFGYEDNTFISFKEKYFNLFKKYPSLEMFYDYNVTQKILSSLSRQKITFFHDEQKLFLF
ncbi:MAG: hypothetical protein LBD32_01460 [Cytophagales bacterium]|jgi:hypothetical protein|nr:hypothetical protein [Cytophagales bacterium]